jgi:hypothetical protein
MQLRTEQARPIPPIRRAISGVAPWAIATAAIATLYAAPAQAGNLTYSLSLTVNATVKTLAPLPTLTIPISQSATKQVTVIDDPATYTDGSLDWDGLLAALGLPINGITTVSPITLGQAMGGGSIWLQSTPGTTGAFSIANTGIDLTPDAIGILGQCRTVACGFAGNFDFQSTVTKAFASAIFPGASQLLPPSLTSLPIQTSGTFSGSTTPVAAVPTPSLLGGMVLFGWRAWRRKERLNAEG